MIASADAARVEYRSLSWAPGYRFGSDGSVWSRRVRGRGTYFADRWHRLNPTPKGREGYLVVKLGLGGKSRLYQVHRLICEVFHGPCPPEMEACHFPDRDPSSNRADNLRWGTSRDNKADMAVHGTRAEGERHGRAKLTEGDVRVIRDWVAWGLLKAHVARRFGVTSRVILDIAKGRTWRHVS